MRSVAGTVGAIGRSKAPPVLVVAIVVFVLALAELGASTIDDRFPVTPEGDEQELVVKSERMDAVDGPIDVAFVSSSMIDAGIDPHRFVDASTRAASAFNASGSGLPTGLYSSWTRRVVIPSIDPRIVIVGLHPMQLGATPPWDAAAAGRAEQSYLAVIDELDPDPAESFVAWVADRSSLVEHREQLRSPAIVARAAVGDVPPPTTSPFGASYAQWNVDIDDLGGNLRYVEAPSEPVPPDLLAERLQESKDLGVDRELASALLRDLVATGRSVVLLIPPINTEQFAQEGIPSDRFDEARGVLLDAAERLGVPVIDLMHAGYPSRWFRDHLHLVGEGRAQFSADVAAALDALCAAGRIAACPVP